MRGWIELFDPHLFQKPAAFDFLRGDDFKAFRELGVPIVALHLHQRAGVPIHPEHDVRVLRVMRGGLQLKLPAAPRANGFFPDDARIWPVKKFQREILVGDRQCLALCRSNCAGVIFSTPPPLNFFERESFSPSRSCNASGGLAKEYLINGSGLRETEWNNGRFLAQLSLQIDLLLALAASAR